MKTEKIFSKNGFYMFVLESNLMLHKHVATCGQKLLSDWLAKQPASKTISVLDLACGGYPISISTMLAAFLDHTFQYTGIDINSDQVNALKTQFKFPANVCSINVYEGNAWDFSSVPLENKYDIIFTGLNLHHGTPEEIYCLLQQCKEKLNSNGLFINHDFYRPSEIEYMRRPQTNPSNHTESFAMVPEQTLAKYANEKFNFPEVPYSLEEDWKTRTRFLATYLQALKDHNGDEAGIKEVIDHIRSRDFPISLTEMKRIADKAGFKFQILDLDASDQPLGEYFQMVSAALK